MGQTQGHELPFDIGERFTCLSGKSIWEVHTGRRKVSGDPVTVFVFDYTDKSADEVKTAQTAHLRLKTLRHPNILKYIDGIELPTSIYMVTEVATPLEDYLTTTDGSTNFSMSWGIHQVIKAISFLSKDCGLVHRNVCLSSIYVDTAGEWKLAGVEYMHSYNDSSHVSVKSLEVLRRYDPPEVGTNKRTEKWSTDVWGLGCLLWEVFNGPLTQVSALRNTAKIPKNLTPHYCEMVSANPRSRPNPSDLLTQLREHGGFLANHFVSIALTIEEVQIMEPTQRNDFFNNLNNHLDSFPNNFSKCKILPQLLNAFEFGGAGSSVLGPLFKLGSLLDEEDYQKKIVPCVVKLFSSTDRATRLNLLKQLEHFIGHLQTSTVNQIFPSIANGFSDTVPAMREQTVKAMVLVTPKLSGASLSGQLLKHLAKCQMDEVPSIRVNTNICLGKIAGHLDTGTRRKVLATAFIRAFKDPFPPARISAITSMASTHSFFSTSDIATKILPALSLMTLDQDKPVRDQTFQTIYLFLQKLERISEDPQAAQEQQKAEAAGSTSWTGWAMSSLTSKFYKVPVGGGVVKSPAGGDVVKAPAGGGVVKDPVGGGVVKSPASGGVVKYPAGGGVVKSPTSEDVRKEELVTNKSEGQFTDKQSEGGGDWDEEKWEDFPTITIEQSDGCQGQQDSWEEATMEGWDDTGWENTDLRSDRNSDQQNPSVSSGADFFDTLGDKSLHNKVKTEQDYFDILEESQSTKSQKKTSPPLVSSSLFGDEWGDWEEDFDQPKQMSATSSEMKRGETLTIKEPPLFTTMTSLSETPDSASQGWDYSNWSSLDETSPKSLKSTQDVKQQQLQEKRQERKLKQQAAREKRATGVGLRPGGLGSIKKDRNN